MLFIKFYRNFIDEMELVGNEIICNSEHDGYLNLNNGKHYIHLPKGAILL